MHRSPTIISTFWQIHSSAAQVLAILGWSTHPSEQLLLVARRLELEILGVRNVLLAIRAALRCIERKWVCCVGPLGPGAGDSQGSSG
eukprot:2657948-Rhodomonas_salina.1